jgi:ribonuclease HII
MIKGDQVAACVAAASVVAKVTRDRLLIELHDRFPAYGFNMHKGYITREHSAALAMHGPCPEHRFSFVNVARLNGVPADGAPADGTPADETWGQRALEDAMQENESEAAGRTDGYGAALEGVTEQVV